MDITVVICTYNGAERIPDVLESLRRQEGLESVDWHVLVIDNNSSDGTADVARAFAEDGQFPTTLDCVTERRQGLAFARQRAVDEAEGDLVAFLDDDNVPDPDWVLEAVRFGRRHPRAGAFGGKLIGEYEVEPPGTFPLVSGLFALNEADETFSYSDMGSGEFPPGAGLVVRRRAWEECVPVELSSSGVSGSSRANVGEDIQAQWFIHDAGWEIWHNARMSSLHRIPGSRFEPEYLDRFFSGIGRSRHQTRMLRYPAWKKPFMILLFGLNDLRKLVRLRWQYRHKWDDPFVRGRATMLKNMLIRPFGIRQ
jgi:glycosyltransferase involved in cell wall biosynthesis